MINVFFLRRSGVSVVKLVKKNKFRLINFTLKLLLSVVLVYVLYLQVNSKSFAAATWQDFYHSLSATSFFILFSAVVLVPVNLFFEVKKWHLLVNRFEKHSFLSAFLDIMAGITGGLVTPAALGDYAARILRINPENNWKAVWSNFINSLSLNIIVIFAGLAGAMVLIFNRFELDRGIWYFSVITGIILAAFFVLLFFNLHWLKPLFRRLAKKKYLSRVFMSYDAVSGISKTLQLKVLVLSFMRYTVFVLQYYLMLKLWGIPGHAVLLVSAISTIYMMQTVMAVPPVLYWLIRGELALLILGNFSSQGVFILAATFSLWVLNQAFPAIVGWVILMRTNISKSFGYEQD